jgi:hypothetical protein
MAADGCTESPILTGSRTIDQREAFLDIELSVLFLELPSEGLA